MTSVSQQLFLNCTSVLSSPRCRQLICFLWPQFSPLQNGIIGPVILRDALLASEMPCCFLYSEIIWHKLFQVPKCPFLKKCVQRVFWFFMAKCKFLFSSWVWRAAQLKSRFGTKPCVYYRHGFWAGRNGRHPFELFALRLIMCFNSHFTNETIEFSGA